MKTWVAAAGIGLLTSFIMLATTQERATDIRVAAMQSGELGSRPISVVAHGHSDPVLWIPVLSSPRAARDGVVDELAKTSRTPRRNSGVRG